MMRHGPFGNPTGTEDELIHEAIIATFGVGVVRDEGTDNPPYIMVQYKRSIGESGKTPEDFHGSL